jgi:site-specific recombinase XerC
MEGAKRACAFNSTSTSTLLLRSFLAHLTLPTAHCSIFYIENTECMMVVRQLPQRLENKLMTNQIHPHPKSVASHLLSVSLDFRSAEEVVGLYPC